MTRNINKKRQNQKHSTTYSSSSTTITTRWVFKIKNTKKQQQQRSYFVIIGLIIILLTFHGMDHNQRNLNNMYNVNNVNNVNVNQNKDVDVVGSSSSTSEVQSVTTRIEAITKELEAMATPTTNTNTTSKLPLYPRYYMYDDERITLPGIRSMALNDSNEKPTKWKYNWGRRFISYSKHEIKMLQALENHPTLRTYNPSEATFFIIPIPLGATFFWESPSNKNESRIDAFQQILDDTTTGSNNNNNSLSYWFHKYPERHVIGISITEKLFANWWGLSSISINIKTKFKSSMIIRDSISTSMCDGKWMSYPCPNGFAIEESYFKHIVTVGWPNQIIANNDQEETEEEDIMMKTPPTMTDNIMEEVVENWKNNKKYWIFYHTTKLPSLNNSTIFRHALLGEEVNFHHIMMETQLWWRSSPNIYHMTQNWSSLSQIQYQPYSIGYDIPYEEWKSKYYNSKFCLVIRGDAPGSRALPTSINAGCIPIIVSNILPNYQPLFSHTLRYNDFAIMIPENEFLLNPVGSINYAISSFMMMSNNSSSSQILYRKLEGLRLMKRILDPTRSDSLFVPALVKEIVETMG